MLDIDKCKFSGLRIEWELLREQSSGKFTILNKRVGIGIWKESWVKFEIGQIGTLQKWQIEPKLSINKNECKKSNLRM